jgi:hypothetical protein
VRLDLDAARLEADERERDRAAEHPSTVRPNPCRVCVVFASKASRLARAGRHRPATAPDEIAALEGWNVIFLRPTWNETGANHDLRRRLQRA